MEPAPETSSHFLVRSDVPLQLWTRVKRCFLTLVGGKAVEDQQAIDRRMKAWLEYSPPDRMSKSEVEERMTMTSWDVYEKDVESRRSVYVGRPIEKTMQGCVMPLIRKLLKDDPSVQSLVEVGAYYGYMLDVLAREFPALKIHGIDFPDCMEKINGEFKAPNLRFSSGYALDELEAGRLQADA